MLRQITQRSAVTWPASWHAGQWQCTNSFTVTCVFFCFFYFRHSQGQINRSNAGRYWEARRNNAIRSQHFKYMWIEIINSIRCFSPMLHLALCAHSSGNKSTVMSQRAFDKTSRRLEPTPSPGVGSALRPLFFLSPSKYAEDPVEHHI